MTMYKDLTPEQKDRKKELDKKYYQENKERIKANAKTNYHSNPYTEWSEDKKESSRQRHKELRKQDHIKASTAAYNKKWHEENSGYSAQWRKKNPGKIKVMDRKQMEKLKEVPWVRCLYAIKQSAKRRGIEFNLTKEYLESIWTDVCPIFGIKMVINEGKAKDNSYSLDRIDSNKGYVEGNVMVISYRANVIKSMGTAEEHQKIASFLESRRTLPVISN